MSRRVRYFGACALGLGVAFALAQFIDATVAGCFGGVLTILCFPE